MAKIGEKISELQAFVTKDIWSVDTDSMSKRKRNSYGILKIIIISVKGFIDDKCSVRASALTYFTLLSVVPIIALAFAIAKGFGLEQMVEDLTKQTFEGNSELADYFISFSSSMLENTKGGLIAGIGVVMLMYSVFKLLDNVEAAFNHLWQIKNSRTMLRKVTDYITIMIFAPILMIIASSTTIFIQTQVSESISETLSPLSSALLKIIPWLLMAIVFSLIYLIMPNTKVSIKAAVVSGSVTGIIFQIWQWIFVTFQVGASGYGAIYGSFAALPLFLMWVQTSWIIVLIGCKITYSVQNVSHYATENTAGKLSPRQQKRVALYIMTKIIDNFVRQQKPKDSAEWSEELNMSQKMFLYIGQKLHDVGLLAEIKDDKNGNPTYIPSVDINTITVATIYEKLDSLGEDSNFPLNIGDKYNQLSQLATKLESGCIDNAKTLLLKDMSQNQETGDTD